MLTVNIETQPQFDIGINKVKSVFDISVINLLLSCISGLSIKHKLNANRIDANLLVILLANLVAICWHTVDSLTRL